MNVAETSPSERDPMLVFFVEDRTCIRDKHICISSKDTEDSLTLYLAQQLINQSNSENLVTVIHRNGIANSGSHVTGVSTQEEVDTIMILHAV